MREDQKLDQKFSNTINIKMKNVKMFPQCSNGSTNHAGPHHHELNAIQGTVLQPKQKEENKQTNKR